ncbi:MAG: Ppx/GppA family phosphatase, partial [Deltaproteobacteria bacterium]|nr:Ppx/GppA family phosphatase [Deltaproteobacteria bacterium]
MARYATIDVGSHSVLLHVVEQDEAGRLQVLADRVELSRLGDGLLRRGRLGEEAMARTIAALGGFCRLIEELAVEQVAAVGTMCLRRAGNSAAFVARVQRELGLRLE